MVFLDQRDEKVDAGIAATAGDDLAIPAVQLVGDWQIGEYLLEGGLVLPMQREALVLQKARPGEGKGAGAHAANGAAMPRLVAQPGNGAL